MKNISFVGKCVLILNGKEKILVASDIHVGYSDSEEAVGAIMNQNLYNETIADFDLVFGKVGKVNKVILLGDLKHNFSGTMQNDRYDLINLFEHLKKKCDEIIIIKGNHDNYLAGLAVRNSIEIVDYKIIDKYCFLHGDREFLEMYEEKVEYWIMGHIHPAIKLNDGNKIEKYKCFLVGEYNKKKVLILPSFDNSNIGIDVRELDKKIKWDFDLNKFEVFIVTDELKALEFGKLGKIS